MRLRGVRAVVMGASAGGYQAFQLILPLLPANFPVPVFIVQHVSPDSESFYIRHLNELSKVKVLECEDKMMAKPGHVYFAPPNYHMLADENDLLSLSLEERVNFARPSIDVLFETATCSFAPDLIGVLLTGANSDGAKGLKNIALQGGVTIVQDPGDAQVESMPAAALRIFKPSYVLKLDEIVPKILELLSMGK